MLYHAPMERTQISLTAEQAQRLRGLARRRRTSMAALIRDAVDAAYPLAGDADRRWVAALEAVGGFHSGSRSTSEAHDDAVADAFGE